MSGLHGHGKEEKFRDLQFYPTPLALAVKAWQKFKNRQVSRLLEPSAGKGDLAEAYLDFEEAGSRKHHGRPDWMRAQAMQRLTWDAIEANPEMHARLRELGATVVGYDFLAHKSLAIYSHILMNPPFAVGVAHVLHAWNGLYCGEIVAIVNAESIRNPYTLERQQLVNVIEQFGSVEFIDSAFKGDDVYREADVEIALIHLEKIASGDDILIGFIDGLEMEGAEAAQASYRAPQELMLPTGFVEGCVRDFDIAVRAARESAKASALASHFASRIGLTMAALNAKEADAEEVSKSPPSTLSVRHGFTQAYLTLKDAAWANVIRSTHVLSRLSNAARKRVESEFENIKALEFSVPNVYGFLCGLVEQSSEIQMGMVCDVFDHITRYGTDNTLYYLGWKSNDKHRTTGMRVKSTRFILPGESAESWRSSASWELKQMLGDFDRVFAMLDGKPMQDGKKAEEGTLAHLFGSETTYRVLLDGERMASDYFDVRYYKGRGTIHFYTTRPDLIERLNRTVGRYRNWLPPSMEVAGEDFKTQYEQAEKFQAEYIKGYADSCSRRASYGWRDLRSLQSRCAETVEQVNDELCQVMGEVLGRHGLDPFKRIESATKDPLAGAGELVGDAIAQQQLLIAA